jgi:class 3 adenylate cyclase
MMPIMDGYQVLEQVKKDKTLNHIPIVVISAVGELDSIARCIELGAADYLLKPFNPVMLRARVHATLEKKRATDLELLYLQQLQAEHEKSERLLLSIFPKAIAEQLKAHQGTVAQSFAEATILFADIKDFSRFAACRPADQVVQTLNTIFCAFDSLAERLGVEKIKTIGDAYMAVAGLPEPRQDHAEAIAELAIGMQEEMSRLASSLCEPLSVRIGIHTGPVVAGVLGTRKLAYDLWGDTVNTASRMEALGLAGGIQVTPSTYERLSAKYQFQSRGPMPVKGKGEMETYLLLSRKD